MESLSRKVKYMDMREFRDIVISAVALAAAFSIAFSGGYRGIANLGVDIFVTSLIAVSLSFVLHELGHRHVAKHFNCYAEYRMWPHGLLLALLFSVLGFVFAAPGAVMIHPKSDLWGSRVSVSKKRFGLISIAGPVMNLLLAGIFFMANIIFPWQGFMLGIMINIWLAFFNTIPIPPLDGSKIFAWDKRIWLALFAPLAALFILL